MIPVVKEKIKVKLSLTISTDSPIVVLVNKIIETPLVVALKTIKILSNSLIFYCILFVD